MCSAHPIPSSTKVAAVLWAELRSLCKGGSWEHFLLGHSTPHYIFFLAMQNSKGTQHSQKNISRAHPPLGCVEWLLPQVLQYDVLQYTTITGFCSFFAVHSIHSMFFSEQPSSVIFGNIFWTSLKKIRKICKIFNTSLEQLDIPIKLISLQWKQISFGRQ